MVWALLTLTFLFEFLTLCQGRAPIMWTCAIQNTSWHNHLPPQTIYHRRTSSFIVQKSSRCPRDKTNGLSLIHYLLNQSNFNKVLSWTLFMKQNVKCLLLMAGWAVYSWWIYCTGLRWRLLGKLGSSEWSKWQTFPAL